MIDFNSGYKEANYSLSREPRFYAKIYNDFKTVYLTSHQDINIVDGAAIILSGVVKSANFAGQSLTPEEGFSKIGSCSIQFDDIGVTSELRNIFNSNETLNNNRVELWQGFKDLPLADYVIAPQIMWVSGLSNNDLTYTLTLKDTERFTKQTIFNGGFATDVFTSLGNRTGTLDVLSTEGFETVAHDDGWTHRPNEEVGYLVVEGVDSFNKDVKEFLVWDTKTATSFNIIERGAFGTQTLDLKGSDDGEALEVKEFRYLDLPVPKMALAILTGDLYGQAGKVIPPTWHANVSASLVDVASFENIGADLWGFNLDFRGLEEANAKRFIADQVLKINNLAFRVNSNAELELFRFSAQPSTTPSSKIFSYAHLTNLSNTRRNSDNIRNNFVIAWEYRPDLGEYKRFDAYANGESQQRNNIVTDAQQIKLFGLRNSGKEAKVVIDNLAEGIRARKSDESIKLTVTGLMRDFLEMEVLDVVTLDLRNRPEFTNEGLTAFFSCEIQQIKHNFLKGTSSLELFATLGTATGQITSSAGASVTTFNRGGWTEITSVLTGIINGSYYEINDGQTLPDGKYYYDGSLRLKAGFTLTGGASVYIDCKDFDQVGNATYNASNAGPVATQGYFGGGDAAQEGVRAFTQGILNKRFFRRRDGRAGNPRVPASNVNKLSLNALVNTQGDLVGLPEKLYGNGASAGGETDAFTQGIVNGGAAVAGGGGLCLICDNYFFDADSRIILDGQDANNGDLNTAVRNVYGGSSGFGWGGAFICLIKDRSSPLPILTYQTDSSAGLISSKTGSLPFLSISNLNQPRYNGKSEEMVFGDNHVPRYESVIPYEFSDQYYSENASYVSRLATQQEKSPESGIDPVALAKPVSLALQESINTPLTPAGNQSTITMTATPQVGDLFYSYTKFQWRVKGQNQWIDINYDIRNEATVTVASDGLTYEFSAQAVNTQNIVNESRTVEEITVSIVNNNNSESEGGAPPDEVPEVIKVPKPKRLELVNQIDNDENWNKFKSGNAQFRWAAMSVTRGGNIIDPAGQLDLHFAGYKIRIVINGTPIREEIVQQPLYDYTIEKNREDGVGRQFTFQVQALASTSYASEFTEIRVENPEPGAPQNIVIGSGLSSVTATFDLPVDLDFVGVQAYIAEGITDPYLSDPVDVSGNNIVFEELKSGTDYSLGFISLDQFGVGGQSPILYTQTNKVEAGDIGLITEPITLDENGGLVITNNSGYLAIHGAIDAPSESAFPLIFSAYDGNNYPFWIDANGGFKFGIGDSFISFDNSIANPFIEFGPNVTIGSNQDRTVTVDYSGADFTTINDALEALSKTIPAYKEGGFTANIEIQSGYVINEQIVIKGVDLSWVEITSVDSTVNVDGTGFVASKSLGSSIRALFEVFDGGATPVVKLNIDITTPTTNSSCAFIAARGGVVKCGSPSINTSINGFDYAVRLTNSGAYEQDGILIISNSSEWGVLAEYSSTITVPITTQFENCAGAVSLAADCAMTMQVLTITNCSEAFRIASSRLVCGAYTINNCDNASVIHDGVFINNGGGTFTDFTGELFVSRSKLVASPLRFTQSVGSRTGVFLRCLVGAQINADIQINNGGSRGEVVVSGSFVSLSGGKDMDVTMSGGSSFSGAPTNTVYNIATNTLTPQGIVYA